MLANLILTLATSLLATAGPSAAPAPLPVTALGRPVDVRTASWITCTPTSISVDGGAPEATSDPIPRALERAAPGCTITLESGDYPAFRLGFGRGRTNANTPGGTGFAPIVVRGQGRVRIRAGSGGDTLAITQASPVAHITFENLEFEPAYRAGVMFYRLDPGHAHEGFRFIDCDIIGGWDHAKGVGANSKWGVCGHSLKDFEWRGLTRPSRIRDIRQEHGFYLQNSAGDITIENVEAERLGRTFVQFTARAKDGAAGVGNISVRNCRVSDTGLAAGDAHKGGSAFTVSGRMPTATLLFEGNTYRAGFRPNLTKLTRKDVPYGTGAFVAWGEGESVRNGTLILRDNDFRFAAGCGERPVVSIGACKDVRLEGDNHFVAGAYGVALALDQPRGVGTPEPLPNKAVKIATTTRLEGRLELRGSTASMLERAAFGLPSE